MPEIVAEDGVASPGAVSVVAPVVFLGGQPETSADVDGDGELEAIAFDGAAAQGTFSPIDATDGSDGDADVVFVGGAFRGTIDVDDDGEKEMVVEGRHRFRRDPGR